MKLKYLLAGMLLTMGISSAVAQQIQKQYYVAKAGTLISQMTEEEANNVTHLTLTGKINAEDFKRMRDDFHNLEVLDISNAEIKMYSGKGGTYPDKFYVYMANFIPAYAFCKIENGNVIGKSSLKRVIMGDKIKNIEDAAFMGCNNLAICEINRKTPPNLLPDALGDSVTAIFVPLGASDAYRQKDKWKTFAFIEGKPVEAIVEVGALGNLADEIQSQGIQPKEINFLTVSGKLDNDDFKLIRDYMPNLVSINIANTNATTIPEFTFTQKKYLLNIELPRGLQTIGQRSFSNCGRLCGTLVLPPSVTTIDYGAFLGCDNLRHVKVQSNQLTTLGDNLFGDGIDSKLIY